MSGALPALFPVPRFASRSLKNPGLLNIDPTIFLLVVAMVAVDDVSGVDEDRYRQARKDKELRWLRSDTDELSNFRSCSDAAKGKVVSTSQLSYALVGH